MNEGWVSLPRYPVDSDSEFAAPRLGQGKLTRSGLTLLLVTSITACVKCSGILCLMTIVLAFMPCVGIGLLLTGFAMFLAFEHGWHRHTPHDR